MRYKMGSIVTVCATLVLGATGAVAVAGESSCYESRNDMRKCVLKEAGKGMKSVREDFCMGYVKENEISGRPAPSALKGSLDGYCVTSKSDV